MNSLRIGDYHITFLSHHPADKHLCDSVSRWWLEWHEYYLDDSKIPVFGVHMLFIFNPRRNLDLTKRML